MPPGESTVLFRAKNKPLTFSIEQKRHLKTFARTLSDRIANGRPFTCLLTEDHELRRLNNTFLGHDYATDVLSFPSGQSKGELGEMAISIERATSQALQFGHSPIDEIRILMLHGILHLTGMDHERDDGEMARAELSWRAKLALPATLIARSSQAPNREKAR